MARKKKSESTGFAPPQDIASQIERAKQEVLTDEGRALVDQEPRIVIQSRIHEADFSKHVLESGFEKIELPVTESNGLPRVVEFLLSTMVGSRLPTWQPLRLKAAEKLVKWCAKSRDSAAVLTVRAELVQYLSSVVEDGIEMRDRVRAAGLLLDLA